MKKKLFLSLLLTTVAVGYSAAQDVNTTVPAQVSVVKNSTMCEFTPVSHWSFGIKGGTNYFRVAPGALTRGDQFHLILGGNLEYSINPLIGLGVEYMYNPYGHDYQLNATQTGNLEGRTHDVLMYASINLMNLLVPNRTAFWSKMNIYGDAGVGLGFYQFKLTDATGNVIVDSRDLGDGVPETPMAKLGLNLEYNISRTIALGGEVQYRYYDRTNLGGYTMSKGNSDALTATIGLKFKFGATGSKQHARNISMCEYYPQPAPVIIEKIVKDNTIETINRLNALEAKNDSLNAKIKKMNDDLDSISNSRSNEPGVLKSSFQNIEFEFGSDKLTTNSYATLDQIALTLKDKSAKVRLSVAGYTDYIGTEEYNQILSVKRANSVRIYLLNKGVPASSVTITGYGEKDPVANNNTDKGRQANRRVEFQISK
ncbi:OmpA/MotB domain protein [Paludibacter propionicigenes WB4]|uniref:OmpA/MotB domain protein n=1 Tax=Paludibacter propionicigenes (strain DSM 17365 / JCM 13257 / WB4) TaxID=694427 RepID=E4T7S4_PALPW|nr:OmpA family protein [Paludibacter propionicigenes]ADQ80768.1 OmpA/MotB domain protein [Paludibacter propionicigenes WB4]